MKTLALEITDFCNEKCIHCFHPENREKGFIKDLKFLDKMLYEFGENGFMGLTVTGGEPLLHPQFKEICRLGQKNRYILSVKTNGLLIDENLASFFSELKPRAVEISLYSADPHEHDSITGVAESFVKTMEGIRKLKNGGVRCSVMTPVLNGIKHWKELFEIMKEIGVPWGCSQNIHSSFDERTEVEQFKGTESHYYDFLNFVNDHENQKKLNLENKCFKKCGGGISTICVSPDYSVRACIPYPETAGIYTGGNAKELLEKARDQLKKRFAKLECHQCELVKYCAPCPAHLKFVDGVGICDPSKKAYVEAYLRFFGKNK